MAAQSTRVTTITFTGDVEGTQTVEAAANTVSPAGIAIQALASGANTITVPTSTGVTVTACTIIPPSGNTTSITLKGVTGDTGIRLHNTDPTSISIYSTTTDFCLTAGAIIQGVRFIWT
jgi:hypothetical protein